MGVQVPPPAPFFFGKNIEQAKRKQAGAFRLGLSFRSACCDRCNFRRICNHKPDTD